MERALGEGTRWRGLPLEHSSTQVLCLKGWATSSVLQLQEAYGVPQDWLRTDWTVLLLL